MVNKNTWFAHWFRGGHGPGFPWPASGRKQEAARKYSRDLWLNDKWPLAKRKLQWVIDKFKPPGWKTTEMLEERSKLITIVYYTANREDPVFENRIIEELKKQSGRIPIISVSKKPVDLGENICVGDTPFNEEELLKQKLAGLKAAKTKYCLAAESDFIYPPEYFDFIPPRDDQVYRYNNVWVRWKRWNYFYKKYYSEGCQICNRAFWIDKIEEALRKGTEAKRVFNTKDKYVWNSENPAISFKTMQGLHYKTIMDKKVPPKRSLPYWGRCEDICKLL
jgi:hypothetical protein